MCPIKTQNVSINFSRPEADFMRRLRNDLQKKGIVARSHGDLLKFLIGQGLRAVSRKAARELGRIRAEFSPRALGSSALLGLLVAGWLAGAHNHQRCLRTATRGRVEWVAEDLS